jgi:hypothetical protein
MLKIYHINSELSFVFRLLPQLFQQAIKKGDFSLKIGIKKGVNEIRVCWELRSSLGEIMGQYSRTIREEDTIYLLGLVIIRVNS